MALRTLRAGIALVLIALAAAPLPLAARSLAVYVVAPSPSTEAEADVIVKGGGWQRVERADAASVLVVVRSGLVFPLDSTYATIDELEDDAVRQPNGTGPRFHVYVYGRDAGAMKQVKHLSYDAE